MQKSPQIVLEVNDLHKSYGNVEVLKGISLTARQHDVISILGASGSGKSTFLRCLNYLEQPSKGRISLRQEELLTRRGRHGIMQPSDRKQLRRFRAEMSMVFQQFNLWAHMTVLENVMEAPMAVQGLSKTEATELADVTLASVGLQDRRSYYPSQLSGGQQQRAAIARALVMKPAVLLFDEPTSSLDPELVGEVLKIMQKVAASGQTMIVVTHEMDFARQVSSRVVFFSKGQIGEQGSPSEVMNFPRTEDFARFLSKSSY